MDSSSYNRIFQHYYKEIESLISELKVEIDQAYSSLLSLEERKVSLSLFDVQRVNFMRCLEFSTKGRATVE